MKPKKEPRCPKCDSDFLLIRYSYNYELCHIECGKCYATSWQRKAYNEDKLLNEWGVGKEKADRWEAKRKAEGR